MSTGLSIGTLQHYFVTRDNLLTAAFLRHHELVVASIDSWNDRDPDPWQRVLGMIDILTQPDGLLLRSKLWIEMASQASRNERIRKAAQVVYDSWRNVFVEAISEGMERGQFNPVLPLSAVVNAFLATLDGYEVAFVIGIEEATPEQARGNLERLAIMLLRVQP